MRHWGLLVLLTSVLVLGGTFVLTVWGPLSGGMLSAVYIGYAAFLAICVVLIGLFDPKATMTPEQAARIDATRHAATLLASHRVGALNGSAFRTERLSFYRGDSLNVEKLEEYLVDADTSTRRLATGLLVAAGPEMTNWAEDRLEELADLADTQDLRKALERVALLARADNPTSDIEEIFR